MTIPYKYPKIPVLIFIGNLLQRTENMPKMKTHKGLKKRVKVTGSGKVKYSRCFGGHLMSSKNAKRRRRISKRAIMFEPMAEKVKIALCQ